ncbi:hypothetical protein TNCV_2036761 [Trichonephila clavipes]|nr:hypothetical protein TNCV_2036761 [Trichonephila clavipes]
MNSAFIHFGIFEKYPEKSKEGISSDDFVFPKKAASPSTPTKTPEPVPKDNSFENLEQDAERSLEPAPEIEVPKPKPSPPIMLKIKHNYRDHETLFDKKFPDLNTKTSSDCIKLFVHTSDENQSLTYDLAAGAVRFHLSSHPIGPFQLKPRLLFTNQADNISLQTEQERKVASLSPVKIIGRLECGRTQLEVSEELEIALSVISRLWQRFQDDATRELLATDLTILNHGQVTRTTPGVAPPSPNFHATSMEGRLNSRQI